MAAFATMMAAEAYARTKMDNGTYLVAHSQRNKAGTISVRALTKAGTDGGWIEITDDA